MALHTTLPVYRDTYQLILKVFEYTKDFPKEYKYTLGQDMKRDALHLIRSIYRANKMSNRREHLEVFLDEFELLKLEIRLCVDMKLLPIKKQATVSDLMALRDEINTGRYQPGRSIAAFIVNKPVKREIFAADFRDRVVHHWLINQLNPIFESAFIYDSYACRKGKGAHLGIQRAATFIRRCSHNGARDAYILKLDIKSFFIRINKTILLKIIIDFIRQHYPHPNIQLVIALCETIILNHSPENCIIKSGRTQWKGLPAEKSLFHAPKHCGLPIGNLTSQVFANFYLNSLDHFIKHDLGVRFYGRYVDDFILVHEDKDFLKSLIPRLEQFLRDELELEIHPKKMYLQHYSKGVPFLGVMLKPHYIHAGRRIKGNFYEAIAKHNAVAKDHKPTTEEQAAFLCSINSYLGLLSHYQTYRLRKKMLKKHLSIWWWNLVYSSGGYRKPVPTQKTVNSKKSHWIK